MSGNARAVIFGRDAATYERARPEYPPEAIGHIEALVPAEIAVEVGAGTGKATVRIARPDLDLTCLEPSPQMAEILMSKDLPGVRVLVSTFEEWDGADGSLDLLYAAQAWHWVDHAMAYRKALGLLRHGGILAVMWNIPHARYEAFEDVYAEHAPELLTAQDERIEKRDSVTWAGDMADAGFAAVQRFAHEWSEPLTPEEVRSLYSTYSDVMMVPEPRRSRFLDGLAAHVEGEGGIFDMGYTTNVFSGVAP